MTAGAPSIRRLVGLFRLQYSWTDPLVTRTVQQMAGRIFLEAGVSVGDIRAVRIQMGGRGFLRSLLFSSNGHRFVVLEKDAKYLGPLHIPDERAEVVAALSLGETGSQVSAAIFSRVACPNDLFVRTVVGQRSPLPGFVRDFLSGFVEEGGLPRR